MKKINKILAIAGLICLASGTVITTMSIALEPGFGREVHEVKEGLLEEIHENLPEAARP